MATAKNIWVVDSETDPFKAGRIPKPFIWGIYNGSEYHEFHTTADFMAFCETLENAIVYAHNGGKFDWHFITDYFTPFEPVMIIAGRLAKFKIGDVEFRDSYNILPMPLSAWQKDEFDYTILEPEARDLPQNKIKISNYLRSDCVNLFNMVSEYIDRYGLHLTQAGTALKVWEKIADIKAPKTNKTFYDSVLPFYYGGRVECFKSGVFNQEFKVIDINSAYPFAMKHLHPYGNSYDLSDELPRTRAHTQRAFITIKCISMGAFPFRDKTGLNFPNDNIERTYTVTGWEFLAATETHTIKNWEIIEVLSFNDSIRFDNYVDHFYDMKKEAKVTDDKAGYIFSKLFLNSLYGKFGANPDNYNEYTIVQPRFIEAAEGDGFDYCADLGKWALCSKPLDEEKARYYNIAVAASITGFVRAYLWKAINACDGVMYCDTDSIACENTGNLELDPETLGAWDVEADCDYGAIGGKKLYAFKTKTGDWKTASKGVRFTPEQIIKVAEGETVTYNPENPSFSVKRGIKFISRKIQKSA